MPRDQFWVTLIAIVVASAAIVAAAILIVRSMRLGTQAGLEEFKREWKQNGAFVITWVAVWALLSASPDEQRLFPLNVLLPGACLTAMVAYVVHTVHALSCCFRDDWNRRVAVGQSMWLLLVGLMGLLIRETVEVYRGMPWVWYVAGVECAVFAPVLVRLIHPNRRDVSRPTSRPHIYRPGEL